MKLLIKHGTIINSDATCEADIAIQNSKIVKIAKGINGNAERTIDAKGKFVLPGLIDMHTHLRTPGREDEEDLHSGGLAAAKGGFTTILCMPNTNPCIDNEGVANWIRDEAEKTGLVSIYPAGAITKNREGKELTEFGALQRAGCLALSDDGDSVENSAIFKRALEYAKMFHMLVIAHCEDKNLSFMGAMRESFVSSKYGINPIPDVTETIRVARDIALAKYLDARLHLAHISCAKSLEIIRRGKERFPLLSCETAPHYFSLSIEDIEKNKFDSNFKVNPPLGEKEDVEAIKEALREGVIDCIATDHAPHSRAEKELPFEDAPFGFIGMELALSLSYAHLVKNNIIGLNDLVGKLSSNPARILGLSDRGHVREGLPADVIVVDFAKAWRVTEDTIVSKSKNTPFMNCELEGVVEHTIRKGKIVYQRQP